jgi:hypothetical protein
VAVLCQLGAQAAHNFGLVAPGRHGEVSGSGRVRPVGGSAKPRFYVKAVTQKWMRPYA